MTDNRRNGRKRAFLTAYAFFDVGHPPMACLVRDLSQTGARLLIDAEELPRVFDLHINGRQKIWRVETVWRRASDVGVRLLGKRSCGAAERGGPSIYQPFPTPSAAFHVDVRG